MSNLNTCIVVVIVIDRSSQTRSLSVLLGTLTWVFAWFTTQLYQLAAVTEPNVIEISNLSILNRAILHLSADIQPDRGGFGKLTI